MILLTAESRTEAPKGLLVAPSFRALYEANFAFVWRTLWRLGVWPASVADAAQDVFIVVHRRLDDLRSSDVARSWVYGIVVRVARDYRRAQQRRAANESNPDEIADAKAAAVDQQYEQREAVALLDRLLDTLDEEKREVLVLVELEQMSVPEIGKLLALNPNTVYTRLRAARADFGRALARHHARESRQP
jgi:RNA polymerase sigma-70 factor, ECF subfamily